MLNISSFSLFTVFHPTMLHQSGQYWRRHVLHYTYCQFCFAHVPRYFGEKSKSGAYLSATLSAHSILGTSSFNSSASSVFLVYEGTRSQQVFYTR